MSDFSMNGVGSVSVVTMPLDKATKTAIGEKTDNAKGKAVALVGNNTVGYGADGDALFGIIEKAEKDGYASIQVKGFACKVTADAAAIGKYAAVDGAGGVKSAADGVVSNGLITAYDDTAKAADIYM